MKEPEKKPLHNVVIVDDDVNSLILLGEFVKEAFGDNCEPYIKKFSDCRLAVPYLLSLARNVPTLLVSDIKMPIPGDVIGQMFVEKHPEFDVLLVSAGDLPPAEIGNELSPAEVNAYLTDEQAPLLLRHLLRYGIQYMSKSVLSLELVKFLANKYVFVAQKGLDYT